MSAFLHPLHAPSLNTPGTRIARICHRRRTSIRVAANVQVSLTTDEAPRLDEPSYPLRPPARPRRESTPRPDRFRGRGEARPAFEIDPDATYYTTCGNCKAAYELKPEQLGERGSKVQCSVCGNEWFQRMDRLMILKETEGLKEYPLEKKEELIAEQEKARRERGRGRREQRGGRRAENSVFIGNLPFSCSQERLEALLEEVEVNRVSIVTDADGRSKGFAFADLKYREDVGRVVEALDGIEVDGRHLSVRVGRRNS